MEQEQRETIDGQGWTEERHAAFLTWMEESFVHRMLSPNTTEAAIGFWPMSRQCSPVNPCHDLPLNRHIPDSATESTGDSRPRPSRLLVESENIPGNRDLVVVANTNRNKMMKRLLSQLDAPLDQVVPQLGSVVDISMKKKRR